MRYFSFFVLIITVFACGESEEQEEPTTGNLMEIEPGQAELDAIAIEEQPELVKDFFAIDPLFFGDDFCYDYNSISQLILHDNDAKDEWSKFEVSDHYLTLYHGECDVMLEFMVFENGSEKQAFLSQMNKGSQQFNYLKWDGKKNTWFEKANFPRPTMSEYFEGISPEEYDLVNEYGADFVYINPSSETATFVYSAWATRMNMGEKQMLEFDREADFNFELTPHKEKLNLVPERIDFNEAENKQYFVAYYQEEKATEAFKKQYRQIMAAFQNQAINSQMIKYGANDFKVYFFNDTFDFHIMEQFEPRNGFWFYQEGKEPLDLGAGEATEEIVRQAQDYFLDLAL